MTKEQIARVLWNSRYPDLAAVFERCLARGSGDTGESDMMFSSVMKDAQAVLDLQPDRREHPEQQDDRGGSKP